MIKTQAPHAENEMALNWSVPKAMVYYALASTWVNPTKLMAEAVAGGFKHKDYYIMLFG